MSITNCGTCTQDTHWSWTEAFDKFGFCDGDGIVMTEHVAEALRKAGYFVTAHPWGMHNVTIRSILTKKGKELIPGSIDYGYDDARAYLPKRIVKLLDAAFPDGDEVEP
ncbi:MAG: hypothetical protein ABL904_24785 [Hyphomicrobiaceae bacterium]